MSVLVRPILRKGRESRWVLKRLNQRGSSSSHRPKARTAKAEPATTTAANTGGTTRSIFERVNRWAGRQTTSPGRSIGTRTEDPSDAAAQPWENEDEGEIAETKATSGEKEATATVAVRSAVQVTA